jgi:hypothetical protein
MGRACGTYIWGTEDGACTVYGGQKMGHLLCMGDRRSLYRILEERPEGKIPLVRHRHRWEDNIRIDL